MLKQCSAETVEQSHPLQNNQLAHARRITSNIALLCPKFDIKKKIKKKYFYDPSVKNKKQKIRDMQRDKSIIIDF